MKQKTNSRPHIPNYAVLLVAVLLVLPHNVAQAQEVAAAAAAGTPTVPAAVAATQAKDKKAAANGSQMGSGLQLEGGYRNFLNKDKPYDYYYTLKYLGNPVSTHGTAFASDTPTVSGTQKPAIPAADTYDLSLRIERGVGKYDGPLADILKTTDLRATGLGGLRGVIQAYGRLDPRLLNFAAGVELPTWHPLPTRLEAPSFVIAGVQQRFQTHDTNATASGGSGSAAKANQDAGFGTLRYFAGRNFRPTRSDARKKRYENLVTLQSAPSYSELRESLYKNTLSLPDTLTSTEKNETLVAADHALDFLLFPQRMTINDSAQSEVNVARFVDELKESESPPQPLPAGTTLTTGMLNIRKMLGGFLKNIRPVAPPPPSGTPPGGLPSSPPPDEITQDEAEAFAEIMKAPLPTSDAQRAIIESLLQKFLRTKLTVGLSANKLTELFKTLTTPVPATPATPAIPAVPAVPAVPEKGAWAEIIKIAQLKKLVAINPKPTFGQIQRERFYANRLLLEYAFPSIRGISDNRPLGSQTAENAEDKTVLDFKIEQVARDLTILPDRWANTLWLEGAGQVYFYGDAGNGTKDRYNHIFAATLTNYLNPSANHRNWIRLQYQNGRDRSAPDKYRNYLTATLGFEL